MKRLLLLALAAVPLFAQQTPVEAQNDRLARQMAAQQGQQAIVTQQFNAENDRLIRNAAQQRIVSLEQQYRDASNYSHPPAQLKLIEQQQYVQQTLLSSIEQRQNVSEQQLQIEIDRLRTNLDRARAAGLLSAYAIGKRQEVIARYQADLQRMRDERRENSLSVKPPRH